VPPFCQVAGLPVSSVLIEVFNLEAIETGLIIVIINLRLQLILYKCIVCCVHEVFVVVTFLIITDIGRFYFDKGGLLARLGLTPQ
jgi:hypothetical protein